MPVTRETSSSAAAPGAAAVQKAGEDGSVREMFYAEALNDALRIEMRRDPKVIVLGEDIAEHGGAFQVTAGLLAEFGPDRIRQTPISEIGLVGTAVGAALTGLRPVAELMYIDFSGLAMDQIVNQAAQNRFMFGGQARVPLVVRTQGGSGRGNAAQHSKSLEAWFTHVAGLKVVMPATPADAKGLLAAAIRDDDPVMFIEHKLLYRTKGQVPTGEHLVPLGKADVKREGKDVTIVTWSREVLFSLEAAAKLAEEGIEAEVVDVRSLVPLDKDMILTSVRKTRRVLVVHEAIKRGGYGGEIAALVAEEAFDDLDAPPRRLAGRETPIPYAQPLELGVVPQVADIVDAARALVNG
jgi:pyruvate/2-oxoglutarate/acetoin dehydrogenase E1 component